MWKIKLLALFLCLMPFHSALAEGGSCPPGYYPVNSPGVMGCAPIPNAGGGVPDVGPLWVTSWGAISVDGPARVIGASHSQRSKRKANAAAIADCMARGGVKKNCKVLISFYNQCGSIAGGDTEATTYSAGTAEQAGNLALQRCSGLTSNCKILQTTCSYPMRVD